MKAVKNPGTFVTVSSLYKTVSAKGAVVIQSLGHRPREMFTAKSLALKARFIRLLCRIPIWRGRAFQLCFAVGGTTVS